MNILIIGATGKTGQKLLACLNKTDHQVSGLIRQSSQADQLTEFGTELVVGDLENFDASLATGFDAIIFVAGSGGKNVQGVDYQGLVNVVDAAIQSGVQQFLYIGSINAGKQAKQYVSELEQYYHANNKIVPENLLAHIKKPGYQAYVDLKTKAERYLIDSGLNYTILRGGLLTQEPASGKVNATPNTLHAFGEVSRENMALCFIQALGNKNTYQEIYTLLDGDTIINKLFLS